MIMVRVTVTVTVTVTFRVTVTVTVNLLPDLLWGHVIRRPDMSTGEERFATEHACETKVS